MSESDENPSRCEFEMDNLVVKLEVSIPSVIDMIEGTVAKIMDLIAQSPCWDNTDSIELVLQEALANAILHGNRADPRKLVNICVALQTNCSLLIVVKDTGSGFDPNQLPNPVVGENLFAENCRGIFLINRLMEDVRFSFDQGTAVHMRRTLSKRA